ILLGSLALYRHDLYDYRLLAMTIAVSMAIPVTITTAMHRFENIHFTMLRQLPVSSARRMLNVLVALIILSLPETGLLLKNFPENLGWDTLMASLLFTISIPFLFYSLQYTKERKEED